MTLRIIDRPISALVAARCRLLGFSPRTAQSYSQSLVHFEDWTGVSAMQADQHQAAAWLVASAEGRSTLHTVFHRRCAIAFLFRQLRATDIDDRIVPRMRIPKPKVHRVADPEELALVFRAISNPEHRLFCQFVYATGLRLREALAVTVADIDLSAHAVVVRQGKGGRQRSSILSRTMRCLLEPRVRARPHEMPLFTMTGRSGRPSEPEGIHEGLRTARRRAGVADHLTIHGLRRCFATHLHERGVGMFELQRLLGHSSVITTMRYIGLRDERRAEILRVGDLLADLPQPAQVQQRIALDV